MGFELTMIKAEFWRAAGDTNDYPGDLLPPCVYCLAYVMYVFV